jgi:DNA-directed RNA polymerase omega subunit
LKVIGKHEGAGAIMATKEELEEVTEDTEVQEIDSKYRLIILAAKRSKQLQRGAHPRIDIDTLKHKNTRVALEEVMRGRVKFTVNKADDDSE